MRRSVSALLLVAAAAVPQLTPQDATLRLWVVGDGVRVSPLTGRLLENRPDIHRDYPSSELRARNAVWDPAARTATVKCARNEYCAFQLVIESAKPADDIDVRLPGLDGPNGARIDGPDIAIFKEWYVPVRRASTGYERSSLGPEWYADALLP